jgi:argininosuccinate lyase
LSKARYTEGRLQVQPSDEMKKYVLLPQIESVKKRFPQYLLTDFAHTVMLAEEGIIPKADAAKILSCLREIEKLGPEKLPIDPEKGSLLLQVEAYMFSKIGDAAGKMHTGRSRNDQGAAIARLYARDEILGIFAALLRLQGTLLNLAEQHVETVMPSYTHIQHAQPITFAHYLLSNFYPFHRDMQRLSAVFERMNMNSLGGVAIAGTSWPLNRRRTMELTGCDGIVVNSKDAIGFAPDYIAEMICDCALVMSNLGHLISDLYVWSSYEFGMVEIGDAYSDTSSIMPQKKNFDSGEKIMGQVGLASGWPSAALAALKMTTSTDCTTFYADHLGMGDVLDKTEGMVTLAAGILLTLKVKKEIMRQRAAVFWSTASNLADTLVRETGISFRSAHSVVARIVRIAIEEGKRPDELTGALVDLAAQQTIGRKIGFSDDTVRKALDPSEFIRTRVTMGSPNPKEVLMMIADARAKLQEHDKWLSMEQEKIKAAMSKLKKAIDQLSD